MKLQGSIWHFGDNLGATDIVSSKYDKAGMARDWEECRKHLLEDRDPGFSAAIRPGDIVIAGHNLGRGHAHYYTAAVMGCKQAGLGAILCESVNALFQRAAIDLGFLVWPFAQITEMASSGDTVTVDLVKGHLLNLTTGAEHALAPLPTLVADIVNAGSSLNWALSRVGAEPLPA